MRTRRAPVDRTPMAVGDKVKFAEEKQPYTVRAISSDGRWVICTKPFNLRRTVLYTVIDFDSGVRGPDNYRSLGYETPEQIASAMEKFEAGEAEVSHRYDAYLRITDVRRADATAGTR